jgi:hypothetical protein
LPTDAAMTTRRSSLPETLVAGISFPPFLVVSLQSLLNQRTSEEMGRTANL